MTKIEEVKSKLADYGYDAVVIYDFRHRSNIAPYLLGKRIWFSRPVFMVFRKNKKPVIIVSYVDKDSLDGLRSVEIDPYPPEYIEPEGAKNRVMLHLNDAITVAVERSHHHANRVLDVETADEIFGNRYNLVSTDPLFLDLCRFSPKQLELHKIAAFKLFGVRERFFTELRSRASRGYVREGEMKAYAMEQFRDLGLVTSINPYVAFGANSASPHYDGRKDSLLRDGDWILFDACGMVDPNGPDLTEEERRVVRPVYADTTTVGYRGALDPLLQELFSTLRQSQDIGLNFLNTRLTSGLPPTGREVCDRVRAHISEQGKGFERYFMHRTGHSLSDDLEAGPHGLMTNLDGYERFDNRRIPNNGYAGTIEQGLYVPTKGGVRLQLNFITQDSQVVVTTRMQDELYAI